MSCTIHHGITLLLTSCIFVCTSQAQTHSPRPSSHGARVPAACKSLGIDVKADSPLQPVTLPPSSCSLGNKNGFRLPDPNCTPGAVNPTVTLDVLMNPQFTTKCVRDQATSPQEKAATYRWYGIAKPSNNTGASQSCELDHLISLELGGADTLDNIWPQCGPSGVTLNRRFFKRKDTVENYLAKQVRDGKMNLPDAQRGIATDWTQYLEEAEKQCPNGRCQ